MTSFTPLNSNFQQDIQTNFEQQSVMHFIGAELVLIEPGRCEIGLPYRQDLSQQNGFLHAGITTTIADSACGYAALSLMPAGSDVLSVEFKINMLRPASGERFIARAEVLKPGRTLVITRADVFAIQADKETLIAAMQATMYCQPSTFFARICGALGLGFYFNCRYP